MSGDRAMFRELVRVFERERVPYCILAGYDSMPDDINSDIDFMVDPAWADRLPALIQAVARTSGAHVVQCIQHETTAAYFVLARRHGHGLAYLHPDSSTDYRRGGRLWMRAAQVLRDRRRHWYGFWVPSVADAFAYYLIKKIDKQVLDQEQGAELSRRYAEDPVGCDQKLHSLFSASSARAISIAAARDAWHAIAVSLPVLLEELRRRTASEGVRERLRQARADLARVYDRLMHPTGLCIAFLGPDGSGKSTLIESVGAELRESFRQVRLRHLRPGLLVARRSAAATAPHASAPRGAAASLLKLIHFWADYVVGGVLWLYPLRVRSTLVIFDRYYHDLLVDPRRYRYGGPLAPARWLGRLVPQPDLAFVLDAPTEVLQARKQEVPWDESERQRHGYIAAADAMRDAFVIDASRPVDEVASNILARIVEHLEARTISRLALPATT